MVHIDAAAAGSDSDEVEVVQESGPEHAHLKLPERLQDCSIRLKGLHLQQITASCQRAEAAVRPAMLRQPLASNDAARVAGTLQTAQTDRNRVIVTHGPCEVDGAAFATLEDGTWLQVNDLIAAVHSNAPCDRAHSLACICS